MSARDAEMRRVRRSGFGTLYFLLAMLVYSGAALVRFSAAFALCSYFLFINGALCTAFVVALGVMVAARQEGRLVPLAMGLLLVLNTGMATERMRYDLYKYLLAKGLSKEILDVIGRPEFLAIKEVNFGSLTLHLQLYAGLSEHMACLISKQLGAIFMWTAGTLFSEESTISAWLTPFYLAKAPEVAAINNYFPSPPPC